MRTLTLTHAQYRDTVPLNICLASTRIQCDVSGLVSPVRKPGRRCDFAGGKSFLVPGFLANISQDCQREITRQRPIHSSGVTINPNFCKS